MNKKLRQIIPAIFLASFILGSCSAPVKNAETAVTQENVKQPVSSQQTETPKSAIALMDIIKVQPAFADSRNYYQSANLKANIKESGDDVTKAKNYDLMLKALNLKLDKSQQAFLQKNKFLILDIFNKSENFCFTKELLKSGSCKTFIGNPRAVDNMIALFNAFAGSGMAAERMPANSIYISPDVILHTYHVFLDRYFKRLEQRNLYPLLLDTIEKMQKTAFEGMASTKDPILTKSLNQVAAYLTLGKVLLATNAGIKPDYFESPEAETTWGTKDQTIDKNTAAYYASLEQYKNKFSKNPELFQKIKDEINLILKAEAPNNSPLFGHYSSSPTDYTQFTVRSHYNENSVLRAYFRTMMLFGRQTFNFGSPDGFNDAVTLAYVLKKSGVEKDWAKFADVTDFLAGASDDITYKQFNKSISDALGKDWDQNLTLDQSTIEKIKSEAVKLPSPKILSDIIIDPNISNLTKNDLLLMTKGLRLFGQKFTFDAWILNQMTAGQEKTEIALPSTPTSMFVAGAIGSDQVKTLIPDWMKESSNTSLNPDQIWEKLMGIRSDLDKLTPQQWLSNISSGWLWTLAPLLKPYDSGYPLFMQSPLYATKNLQTVLGSYTELKHDTLLYAKQSYAELGGGGGDSGKEPEIVKGFVDPDLEFWARIKALTLLTQAGLKERGLLDEDVDSRLNTFIENLNFYANFAAKELNNDKISNEEYETLRSNFWQISQLIDPFNNETVEEKDRKPALIADIHTDASSGSVLYEATANPYIMLAFVSDQGTPRMVITLVYNHYEFTGPLANRYNDEQWKKKVDDGDLPAKPGFYGSLKTE